MIPLRFPQARPPGFNVPGVPLVPVLGILINVYLMLRLDALTLARFSVWMVVGELVEHSAVVHLFWYMYSTCDVHRCRRSYLSNLFQASFSTSSTEYGRAPPRIGSELMGSQSYCDKASIVRSASWFS